MKWRDLTVPVERATITAQVGGVGGSGGQAVLLVGGATWSRDWWPDALCELFADAGSIVVRFDPRDTGASTSTPAGSPDYSAADLADDAVAVLDVAGVDVAVLLGLSMGGGLAQRVAAERPDRVAGLVLVATSPADGVDRGLPGPTPEVMATFEAAEGPPDAADREAFVQWVVDGERPFAGPGRFDEDLVRESAERSWDRSDSPASMLNHVEVVEGAAPVDLGAVRAPAVVVHGTADPIFPLPHGVALAEVLGARLVEVEGMGHQLPPRADWPVLVDAVRSVAAG